MLHNNCCKTNPPSYRAPKPSTQPTSLRGLSHTTPVINKQTVTNPVINKQTVTAPVINKQTVEETGKNGQYIKLGKSKTENTHIRCAR